MMLYVSSSLTEDVVASLASDYLIVSLQLQRNNTIRKSLGRPLGSRGEIDAEDSSGGSGQNLKVANFTLKVANSL